MRQNSKTTRKEQKVQEVEGFCDCLSLPWTGVEEDVQACTAMMTVLVEKYPNGEVSKWKVGYVVIS